MVNSTINYRNSRSILGSNTTRQKWSYWNTMTRSKTLFILFLSLIQKYKLKKLLRITAYTKRFITNCSSSKGYQGVLITNEINQAETIWIKLPHVYAQNGTDLILKPDESEILRCYGRVPNYHPVYIPRERSLA